MGRRSSYWSFQPELTAGAKESRRRSRSPGRSRRGGVISPVVVGVYRSSSSSRLGVAPVGERGAEEGEGGSDGGLSGESVGGRSEMISGDCGESWVSSWVAGNCVDGMSSGVAKVLGLWDVGGGLLGMTLEV